MGVVAVGAFEEGKFSVDIHFVVAYLYFTETVFLTGGLCHVSFPVKKLEVHGIEVGGLG